MPLLSEMLMLFLGMLSFYDTVNPEIFAIIFIFANSFKRHICDAKNSRLEHDFPISVND